jgi:hypothetical protein
MELEDVTLSETVNGAGDVCDQKDPGFCAPNGKIQAEHMHRVR